MGADRVTTVPLAGQRLHVTVSASKEPPVAPNLCCPLFPQVVHVCAVQGEVLARRIFVLGRHVFITKGY